jgi:hypothetical protein
MSHSLKKKVLTAYLSNIALYSISVPSSMDLGQRKSPNGVAAVD